MKLGFLESVVQKLDRSDRGSESFIPLSAAPLTATYAARTSARMYDAYRRAHPKRAKLPTPRSSYRRAS